MPEIPNRTKLDNSITEGRKSMERVRVTEEDAKKLGLKRVVKLAINVFDLNLVSPLILKNVLTNPDTNEWRISQDRPIVVNPDKPDEQCAEFVCGILTAALCLDLLRNELRGSKSAGSVRGYLCQSTDPITKKPIWKRLPYNAILTHTQKGKISLNPDVFPMKAETPVITPPKSSFVMKPKKKSSTGSNESTNGSANGHVPKKKWKL